MRPKTDLFFAIFDELDKFESSYYFDWEQQFDFRKAGKLAIFLCPYLLLFIRLYLFCCCFWGCIFLDAIFEAVSFMLLFLRHHIGEIRISWARAEDLQYHTSNLRVDPFVSFLFSTHLVCFSSPQGKLWLDCALLTPT